VTERCEPDRILVLDGTSRAAVEAVQSLGKRGLEVHVAARSDCPACRSRWATETLPQPSTPDPRQFAEWLRALGTDYELIIPSTGYSLHRRSPDNVRAAARARGITLENHRSRMLDEVLVSDSDVVVLFDSRNFEAMSGVFPHISARS
jgi:protein-tyrosine-phosphatase